MVPLMQLYNVKELPQLSLFWQIPEENSEDVYLELPSSSQWTGSESDEVERLMNILRI